MKCLCCYRPLLPGQVNYHPACAKRMFGSTEAPELPYDHSQVRQLAKSVIRTQTTVPGVQAKLSLDIQRVEHSARFTIVGLHGRYILKPHEGDGSDGCLLYYFNDFCIFISRIIA